ncbi:uncharacterized protein EI97DRAFT_429381 [Westerdykella ornata]|uniref:Uncharacterized protein n=1 Tax=Westerdykella ornata TaxID=318751 RepID=A0A6A6JXI2_WESOR|nr:uncharacterized protein EI97DRAFT_429381 [Westerdykella ornata]KAF2281330.1 hypothetical protein EI97DRAFT_429381 [Westerdykella ornata]
MSGAPSQPTTADAYQTPANPATKNPSESHAAANSTSNNAEIVEQRIPQTQSSPGEAQEWGLARGVRGAGPGEEAKGLTEEDVGRHRELDGEQMYMPGEGKVADAVAGRGGAGGQVGGEQVDLAADLDRKKAEQAEAREAIKKQRAEEVEEGRLGQRGGPATNPKWWAGPGGPATTADSWAGPG